RARRRLLRDGGRRRHLPGRGRAPAARRRGGGGGHGGGHAAVRTGGGSLSRRALAGQPAVHPPRARALRRAHPRPVLGLPRAVAALPRHRTAHRPRLRGGGGAVAAGRGAPLRHRRGADPLPRAAGELAEQAADLSRRNAHPARHPHLLPRLPAAGVLRHARAAAAGAVARRRRRRGDGVPAHGPRAAAAARGAVGGALHPRRAVVHLRRAAVVDQPAGGRARGVDPVALAARRLRILLLYEAVYPDNIGGVETRNWELGRALGRRGHEVTLAGFCAPLPGEPPNVRVLPMGPSPRLYNAGGRRSTRAALRFAAAVARLDLSPYDVVETANMPYVHLLPLALRCRLARKPLLVSWYEYWAGYWRGYVGALKAPVYRAIEWLTAQLGSAATASSRLTLERLAPRRHRRGTVELVPCGIEVERVKAAAAEGAA